MTTTALLFDPWLPAALLLVLAAVALLFAAYGLYRRARGVLLRSLLFALILLLLANPHLYREERKPLTNIVLLVVDRSPSQGLDVRPQQTEAAVKALETALSRLPNVELRKRVLRGDRERGTLLLGAIRESLAEIDRDRLAAVLVVSDGRIHDASLGASLLPPEVPAHLLLTGRRDESDRALVVESAPSFAIVGEPQELVLRLRDRPEGASAAVPVTVRRDGKPFLRLTARTGEEIRIPFTLEKAGRTVFEIEAAGREGELTPLNNRAVLSVNGVRDRLRVLLVSGLPHQGLRVWRNLLKADPSVDLVHFTILRPPEKQDGTPINELALIAFPTRELFEVKLDEFDLVIFDRYTRRGLLPLVYLDNIARYVEEGGALLEAAGPEFASPFSLYRTPLSRVLPGRPSGEVFEAAFKPRLTELGRRHPVTRGLDGGSEEPAWGRWFRQIDVEARGGEVVMSGFAGRPLLILQRVGKGRVAQLLSDQAWLWARGFEGGGPQGRLLRRLVHWLMREPELEEEALDARAVEGGIEIERRSLQAEPAEIRVTAPSGAVRRFTLTPDANGIARLRVEAGEEGLYRVEDGEHVAYASPLPIAAVELENPIRSAEPLRPLVSGSGGTVVDLAARPAPDVRLVRADRRAYGRGWIGIRDRGRYVVTGSERVPLLPPVVALALLLAALGFAWWREGHRQNRARST